MKTITEFSGIVLRRAAEAQQAFRAEHPQEPKAEPAPEAAPPAEENSSAAEPAEAATEGTTEAATEGEGATEGAAVDVAASPADDAAEAVPAEDAAPAEPAAAESAPVEAAPPEPVDFGTGPEAEAVGAALQVQGDRLTRLMEALDVVGRRAAQVRLVRVVQGDPAPVGAQKRGEFLYLVDLMPRPQAMQRESSDGRRGGPGRDRDGGRGRGGPGGGRGPGGGGGRGPGGPGGGPGGSRGPGGPGAGRGPGGPGGAGGSRSPAGAHGSKFTGDRAPRDEGRETPRGGPGWTLSRPPNERVYAEDANAARNARPPRDPRFDQRGGPRPPQGDRPPRGPRPDGAAGGAPLGDGRRDNRGPDRGPRPANAAGRPGGGGGPSNGRRGPGPGPGSGPGPRRPEGGRPQPPRNDRNWSGPRRGGWDEPAVVPETAQNPAAAAAEPVVPPAPEPASPPPPAAPVENAGTPSTDSES